MSSKLVIAAVVSASFLTACFHDKVNTAASNGNAISVIAVSGKMVELQGTFTRLCDSQSAGSEQNVVTISGNQWTNVWRSYATTDCSGSVTSTEKYGGTLTAGVTGAITGWVDGNEASSSAPIAANTTSSLSDTESYTTLSVKLVEVPSGIGQGPAVGDSRDIFYIVDDTGTGLVLYEDEDLSSGRAAAVNEKPLYSAAALPSNDGTVNNKVSVVTVSGNSIELNGTFTRQCDSSSAEQINIAVSNDTWTYTVNNYTGVSTDCSGTPSATDVWVGTMVAGATKNITGWDMPTAPTKADSSGVLSDTEPYTPLVVTFSSIPASDTDTKVGDEWEVSYVIDDTSTGLILYPNGDLSTGAAKASSTEAYYSADATIPVSVGKPDLQITIDTAVNSGFDVNLTYTVTNVGDGDAGGFSVMLWTNRSETQQPDYTSNQCCGSDTITSLAAGASKTGTMTWMGTWLAGNTYHAYVIADFFEEVAESDEGVTGTNDNLGHLTWVAQ